MMGREKNSEVREVAALLWEHSEKIFFVKPLYTIQDKVKTMLRFEFNLNMKYAIIRYS